MSGSADPRCYYAGPGSAGAGYCLASSLPGLVSVGGDAPRPRHIQGMTLRFRIMMWFMVMGVLLGLWDALKVMAGWPFDAMTSTVAALAFAVG